MTFSKDYKEYEKYYKLIDLSEYTLEDKKRILRNNKIQKEKRLKKSDSCSIVTFGYPDVGKTIFLASLFNFQRKNDRLRAESFILETIQKTFGKKGAMITNDKSADPKNEINDEAIKARYTLSVTEPTLSYLIIYIGLGELKFYDVPGEIFKAQDNLDDTKIVFADGFQALIDGASRSPTAIEN